MAEQLTAYELERQRRIAENKRRMMEMGVLQASEDLRKSLLAEQAAKRAKRAPRMPAAPAGCLERRRSTRVAGLPAKTYDEAVLAGQEEAERARRGRLGNFRGCTEEKYTKEQLELLGSYEMEWELFVDGYDLATGKRIYDHVNGKTCHQCRQKTLGKRTCCSRCNTLSGVLCGDCLFMRYGENIDEVLAKDEWVCPHCRGFCNCSFHRNRRGWMPTGLLYRRAIAEGYQSVAHYLVMNNQEDTVSSQEGSQGSDCSDATHASPPSASARDGAAAGPDAPLTRRRSLRTAPPSREGSTSPAATTAAAPEPETSTGGAAGGRGTAAKSGEAEGVAAPRRQSARAAAARLADSLVAALPQRKANVYARAKKGGGARADADAALGAQGGGVGKRVTRGRQQRAIGLVA